MILAFAEASEGALVGEPRTRLPSILCTQFALGVQACPSADFCTIRLLLLLSAMRQKPFVALILLACSNSSTRLKQRRAKMAFGGLSRRTNSNVLPVHRHRQKLQKRSLRETLLGFLNSRHLSRRRLLIYFILGCLLYTYLSIQSTASLDQTLDPAKQAYNTAVDQQLKKLERLLPTTSIAEVAEGGDAVPLPDEPGPTEAKHAEEIEEDLAGRVRDDQDDLEDE